MRLNIYDNDLIAQLNSFSVNDWKTMNTDKLKKDVIEPLGMIGEERVKIVISSVEPDTYSNLTKRLWNEQNREPSDDPDEYENAYYETLPIIVLLERIVRSRLPLVQEKEVRNDMMQQLATLKLIMSPFKLQGMADSIQKTKDENGNVVGYSSICRSCGDPECEDSECSGTE